MDKRLFDMTSEGLNTERERLKDNLCDSEKRGKL